VLKGFGGYSKLAERAIDARLGLLSENPRVAEWLDGLRITLVARLPEIRQRLQEIISRVRLLPTQAETNGPSDVGKRLPLNLGSHPEVTLQSAELRLLGRVDLITVTPEACEIVDYKTGVEVLHHHDQLRLYALL